ncbi:Nitrous oxide reductase maturation periplasmic protein NosX [Litoreibacter arenae DSM 19593]|uniref:FAD:protein FMN transferase n=2 Tax=Litoreibacter TaxID=947567 RepID=S9RX35_9RHOB|nr:Nitrous oxide reductase maturation periplasmic protein NosX [Litoreibacter arenae DSM 19593]
MGAQARMTLAGPVPKDQARSILRAVEHELARLERIFSLHHPRSQIVQLNSSGILKAPASEFVEVLDLCDHLNMATKGAFDPTLQPLWLAHARSAAQGRIPSEDDLMQARDAVGWEHLRFDAGAVRFGRAGCSLTLNGVAQGYVTDRIANLLRQRGLSDILVDMGEIAALGKHPWPVGIVTPGGDLVSQVTLQDRAMATSAPMGTLLAPEIGLGHIIDPRNTENQPRHKLVSVSANSAALADGLSTAFCLMTRPGIQSCLEQTDGAKLEAMA